MIELETFEQLETLVRVLGEQNAALAVYYDKNYKGKIKYTVEIVMPKDDDYFEFHGETLQEALEKCISSPIFKTSLNDLTS